MILSDRVIQGRDPACCTNMDYALPAETGTLNFEVLVNENQGRRLFFVNKKLEKIIQINYCPFCGERIEA